MTGEDDHIDSESLHVDGEDAGGLGGIDDEGDAALAADSADVGNRMHRANHVCAVIQHQTPSIWTHGPFNFLRINEALRVERYDRSFGAVVAHHMVYGANDGVVLLVRCNDVVTSRKQAGDDEVKRIGNVVGEYQTVGRVLIAAEE